MKSHSKSPYRRLPLTGVDSQAGGAVEVGDVKVVDVEGGSQAGAFVVDDKEVAVARVE